MCHQLSIAKLHSVVVDAAAIGAATVARGGTPAQAAEEAACKAKQGGASEVDAQKASALAACAAVMAAGGSTEEAVMAAAQAAGASGATLDEVAQITGEAAQAAMLGQYCCEASCWGPGTAQWAQAWEEQDAKDLSNPSIWGVLTTLEYMTAPLFLADCVDQMPMEYGSCVSALERVQLEKCRG